MGRRSKRRRISHRPALLTVTVLIVLVVLSEIVIFAAENQALVGLILLGGITVVIWSWNRRRYACLRHARTLPQLLALTPTAFEETVADLLRALGYCDVRRVGGAGDLGADLVGHDRDGHSIVVQCKRYAPGSRVGSPAIQAFIGMVTVHHLADRGLFVTTSDFTAPAVELARRHRVTLIDGRELTRLVPSVLPSGGARTHAELAVAAMSDIDGTTRDSNTEWPTQSGRLARRNRM